MKPAELEYITVGQILAPWGNKGQLKVRVVTDFPQRFTPSARVYVNRQPTVIDSVEWHKGNVVIKLNNIDHIEAAQRLRGQPIEIHHSQLNPLPEGQYYHFQLVGLEVWTTQGVFLGNITEIMTAQSNDVYIVQGSTGEILLPAIEDVVKSIDLNQGKVAIEPIEGLLSSKPKNNRTS
jgi:16S rRNA processing protein RimM